MCKQILSFVKPVVNRIASIMETLTDLLDRLNKQESITTGFKLHCLNTIIKFIKDDNQLIKEYSNLTTAQAKLINILICYPSDNSDIGYGFKSFYAPLWDALREYGVKYEFNVQQMNGYNNQIHLVLEKIPKVNKNENITVDPMDISESELDMSRCIITRTDKKLKNKTQSVLKSISPEFAKQSLNKIIQFYNDDAMASVTFNKLRPNEEYFLYNFKNVLTSKKSISCFCKSSRIMLETIQQIAETKTNYKVCVKKAKMCDSSNIGITFNKIPDFRKPAASHTLHVTKTANPVHDVSADRSVTNDKGKIKISIKHKSLKERLDLARNAIVSVDNPKDPEIGVGNNKDVAAAQLKEKEITEKVARKKNKKRRAGRSLSINKSDIIRFQKSEDIDKKPETTMTIKDIAIDNAQTRRGMKKKSDVPANANRKEKLIEAMSVPMTSDKALKMMRDMGWEGGALGLRGEGITEPLMPALHLKAKAGLGHVKPPPDPPKCHKTLPEFRRNFLKATLDFVRSTDTAKTISYPTKLIKKEMKFAKHAVLTISSRGRLVLADEEQDLANDVMAAMKNLPGVYLNLDVCKRLVEIHLTKTSDSPTSIVKRVGSLKDILKGTKAARLTNLDLNRECSTVRSYKFTKFKLNLLVMTLKFVKSKDTKLDLDYDFMVSDSKMDYLKCAIVSINERRQMVATDMENALFMEILPYVKDYDLSYESSNPMSVTIKKIYFNQQQ